MRIYDQRKTLIFAPNMAASSETSSPPSATQNRVRTQKNLNRAITTLAPLVHINLGRVNENDIFYKLICHSSRSRRMSSTHFA